jgi:hypothetical protein
MGCLVGQDCANDSMGMPSNKVAHAARVSQFFMFKSL